MLNKLCPFLIFISVLLGCTKEEDQLAPSTRDDGIPQISSTATYAFTVQEGMVYGEGLSHSDWNSDSTTIIPL